MSYRKNLYSIISLFGSEFSVIIALLVAISCLSELLVVWIVAAVLLSIIKGQRELFVVSEVVVSFGSSWVEGSN